MSLPLATSTVLSLHSLKCKFVLVVEDIQDPIKTSNSASRTAGSRGLVRHLFYFFLLQMTGGQLRDSTNKCMWIRAENLPSLGNYFQNIK